MKVLVAYASRKGSTAEIAEAVSEALRGAGLTVAVRTCADVEAVEEYDAVILGSARYPGRWEHDAVVFLQRWGDQLERRPTWLFQSGPCGPDVTVEECTTPHRVVRLTQRFGLPEPVTFGGRVDPAAAEDWRSRSVATGTTAEDFRDSDAIRRWAEGCAQGIIASTPYGTSTGMSTALEVALGPTPSDRA